MLLPAQQMLEVVEFCIVAWNLWEIDFSHVARETEFVLQTGSGSFSLFASYSILKFSLCHKMAGVPPSHHSCSLARRKGRGGREICISWMSPFIIKMIVFLGDPSVRFPFSIPHQLYGMWLPLVKRVKEIKCGVRHGHLSKVNLNLSLFLSHAQSMREKWRIN